MLAQAEMRISDQLQEKLKSLEMQVYKDIVTLHEEPLPLAPSPNSFRGCD